MAKSYKSTQNRFLSFCSHFRFQPLPLSEPLLYKFSAFLADKGLCFRTIKAYISGVCHLHIAAGYPDPFRYSSWPRLEYVLKGIKCSQAQKANPNSRQRLTITPAILRSIRSHWSIQPCPLDLQMLWVAFLLGFLRAGELTVPNDSAFDPLCHLTPQDIAVDCH